MFESRIDYSYSRAPLSRRDPANAARAFLPAAAAILAGAAVALADVDAFVIFVALLGCVFILRDFRLGAVALIVLMPLSETTLVPHSIGGIKGLNPVNLLVAGTLASYFLHLRGADRAIAHAIRPLALLYVAPFIVAGLLGMQHLGEIPSKIFLVIPLTFTSTLSYLQIMLIKPLLIVLFAVLLGAAVARSRRPELFLVVLAISISAVALSAIGFVLASGASLSELASAGARGFFSPLGYHANELGRVFAVAYALTLYTCAATKDPVARSALIAILALVVIALMLTFSRAAFLAFIIVNVLFLLSLRKAKPLLLSALLLAIMVLMLPAEVFDRVMSGWESGSLNKISAGRTEHMWLPLLPDLWRSPIFGNGLGSIVWSDAMHKGTILVAGHAHNAYLNTLLDMGIVGLVLLSAYFFHVWKGFRRLSKDAAATPVLRSFYAGAAAGLVSFLIIGMFGSNLTPCIEQVFLWFAIGMMYGQPRAAAKASPC